MFTRSSVIGLAAAMVLSSCGAEGFSDLADVSLCDPASVTFTVNVDDPFLPLPVGQQIVLEGVEGGGDLLVRMTALDETETVADVETRVIEEYEDGQVVEISRNFFAQTDSGTVCYFGEDVDIYDASGNVASHAGAWRDGQTNLPGVFMPASPRVGDAFRQEVAPGVAEDQAKVIALNEPTEVPVGTFAETVTLVEANPLDGGSDTKVYARGIGLIVDGPARLTSYSAPSD